LYKQRHEKYSLNALKTNFICQADDNDVKRKNYRKKPDGKQQFFVLYGITKMHAHHHEGLSHQQQQQGFIINIFKVKSDIVQQVFHIIGDHLIHPYIAAAPTRHAII